MEEKQERLISIIKAQARIFIQEMGEFYPFGSCLDMKENVIPIGAYIDETSSSVADLIVLLEKHIWNGLNEGNFILGAIAINVSIKENLKTFDAIEIRLFKLNDKEVEKIYQKYTIGATGVNFIP